ncbi:MAG: FAD-dependent monooxygenase [Granulosicoccus sp.]|nr:FAD-dependent monooxygenase [Granulosicoccus sp.]
MQTTQITIAGGGPVGLGLALDLASRDIDVVILERSSELHRIPKGQNLTQRSGELFRRWGISNQIRAASPIPREFGNAGLVTYGTLLSDYHYDWFQRSKVAAYYFAENERLPQYLLENIMRQRLGDFPNVSFNDGCNVTHFEQTADGVSVVYLKNDIEHTIKTQYLVGCDGSRSVVREVSGIRQTTNLQGPRMALLVFRSTELDQLLVNHPGKSIFNIMNPALNGFWQFLGRYDLNGGWFYHVPVATDATADNTDFKSHLHQMVGKPFELDFEHIGFWDLRIRHADHYRKGCVFIAGDAAHSHPPYGGYGVNTGLEDAANLGWKLAAAIDGWGDEPLLDSYSNERHDVFNSVSRDFIERMIKDFRTFLDRYAPQKDKTEFEAAWQARATADDSDVTQFLPNYAGSAMVWGQPGAESSAKGQHSFEAVPGFHLPPPQAVDQTLLEELWSQLTDGGFTLLSIGGEHTEIDDFVEVATNRGIPMKVVSGTNADYGSSYKAKLILVRPDLYVAWTDNTGEQSANAVFNRVLAGKHTF